jgi:alanyl-tRNA synthetase
VGATQKLYEACGALFVFDATVLSCEPVEDGRYAVVLDRTAFFPEGGGQYADTGKLGGVRVLDVQIEGETLFHYTDAPLCVGDSVQGELDADKRYVRMQHHTGEHILSGLIHRAYGYENVGFHLSDEEMTMDVSGPLSEAQLRELEVAANRVVWENHAVTAAYPDPTALAALSYRSKLALTENVRIVTIDGVDACACCAPHVASTAQVGIIRIAQSINYKGGMRLWVVCGERALRLWHAEHDALDAIARSFSASRDEALQSVLRLQKESGELRGELAQCRRELLLGRVRQAAAGGERHLLIFDGGSDANAMRYAAEQGASLCSGACAVFSTEQDGTVRYVCIADNTPLRAVSKDLHAKLGGRGGGSDRMIQGSVPYDENAIRAFFAEI